MLSTSKATTILPVRDMDRARMFYEESLGLTPTGPMEEGTFLFSDDGRNGIELMLKPDGGPSGNTEVSFEVEDLASELKTLESKGVQFEDYDLPGLKTVNHVAESEAHRAAWFTDTEGNILCLHEIVS
ncbi:VOC family protein [Arthrobacter sp. MSA 4-2]|uniref:VOC family protein n=1 Tax=Arthrobacter sp. MSA 4-2 TaxID=2794349 RepID=UPI0018E7B419|nr:VOC family protein [Arthrobacter sp. MSA 4-2]MBJ2120466.1 VOC family protein [Arthrobacter sp. MSA 4-2]